MNKFIFFPAYISILLLFSDCQGLTRENDAKNFPVLVISTEKAFLQKEPFQDAGTVATLSKGDTLRALGPVSESTTRQEVNGMRYDEPWIQVRTDNGKKGWVYAPVVNQDNRDSSGMYAAIMHRRLLGFFNPDLAARVEAYARLYQTAATSRDFLQLHDLGKT